MCTGLLWRNLRENDNFEGPGVNGRIILKLIFRKWYEGRGPDSSGSG